MNPEHDIRKDAAEARKALYPELSAESVAGDGVPILTVDQLDDLNDDWCVPNRDLPMAEAWDIIRSLLDTAYAYRDALKRARQDMEDWAAYATDYFKEKWDLAADLAAIDAVLNDGSEGAAPLEDDSYGATLNGALRPEQFDGRVSPDSDQTDG